MSRADHPSNLGPVCATGGCTGRPAARVTLPLMPECIGVGLGFTIIRPASTPNPVGDLACLDCAHAAVDQMLMNATTPGLGPVLEQREDGAL